MLKTIILIQMATPSHFEKYVITAFIKVQEPIRTDQKTFKYQNIPFIDNYQKIYNKMLTNNTSSDYQYSTNVATRYHQTLPICKIRT